MANPETKRESAKAPIEVFTPEVALNPYPIYRVLRDEYPVYLEPQLQTFLVTRWDDVVAVLSDWKTFTSTKGVTPEQDHLEKPGTLTTEAEIIRRGPMLTDDPPRHKEVRRLVNQAFTLRRIEQLRPAMRRFVDELLDAVPAGESVDIVHAFSGPLPAMVVAEMLGISRERSNEFRAWAEALFVDSGAAAMQAAVTGVIESCTALIAERRNKPREDLITALTRATIDGDSLDDRTLLGLCFGVIAGGNETTTHLISNLLDLLADRPELWCRLRDDRRLVEGTIEETLRLESPTQVMWRATTRDVELHGVLIPQGAKVGVVFASANRDERRFTDPEEFRIDRNEGEHAAFGYGHHYCIGAPLSRTETGVALNAMLDRYSRIERGVVPPIRVRSSVLHGFKVLPLRLIAD